MLTKRMAVIYVLSSIGVTYGASIPTGVPAANPRGGVQPNTIAPGYSLTRIATGVDPLENPSGVITSFGYLNDDPAGLTQGTKTEADENTYLVFDHNLGGPTPGYDYGRHYLFQGHENAGDLAYITRINLDVTDPSHRITLLTPVGSDGKTHLNDVDGSTWNPFTNTLLFTQENGSSGGVVEVTANWPPVVRTLDGILGRAGYEGVRLDSQGNLILLEDVGGTSVNTIPGDPTSPAVARQPNSFVFRFVPYDRTNLAQGGKLQALQVTIAGTPITFHASDPTGDIFSAAQLALHTLGTSWPAHWVTVHDTAVDGVAPFNANALAKTAGATPFRRPENGQFLPGSNFQTFFFDETGDTDARAGQQPELAARGSWGSIFRFDFPSGSDTGTIAIFVLGNADQASFDNLTFVDSHTMLVAEDRGDLLHGQLNKLDSVWAYDIGANLNARRFLALGEDPVAAAAAAVGDGDNEPTGLNISEGAADIFRLLGRPAAMTYSRWFLTQQHGQNNVYEIVPVTLP